jgi:hypothetical protein
MWQTICVILIVAVALATAVRSFYRMATGKDSGCGACTGNCASCPAGCGKDEPSPAGQASLSDDRQSGPAQGGREDYDGNE